MKSKRAKEHIDELSSRHGLSVYEVEQAVALAEEDAEERAIDAFEKMCVIKDNYKIGDIKKFKQLLNGW